MEFVPVCLHAMEFVPVCLLCLFAYMIVFNRFVVAGVVIVYTVIYGLLILTPLAEIRYFFDITKVLKLNLFFKAFNLELLKHL